MPTLIASAVTPGFCATCCGSRVVEDPPAPLPVVEVPELLVVSPDVQLTASSMQAAPSTRAGRRWLVLIGGLPRPVHGADRGSLMVALSARCSRIRMAPGCKRLRNILAHVPTER